MATTRKRDNRISHNSKWSNDSTDDNNDTLQIDPSSISMGHRYTARSTALLVVDVQPEYWSFCPEVRKDFPNFPTNIARAISTCRCKRVPIVWIRADYRYNCSPWLREFERMRGEECDRQITFNSACPLENEWEEFAKPNENEIVIPKHSFSAMLKTPLLDILEALNVQNVLVCGLITSLCVHHSCYSLFDAGFRVILIEDACADRGIERHNSVIKLFGDYIYHVISSKQVQFDGSDAVSDKHPLSVVGKLADLQLDYDDNGLPNDDQSSPLSRSTSRTVSVESLCGLDEQECYGDSAILISLAVEEKL